MNNASINICPHVVYVDMFSFLLGMYLGRYGNFV